MLALVFVCRVICSAVGRRQFGSRQAQNRTGIGRWGTLRAECRCNVSQMVVLRLQHCVGEPAPRRSSTELGSVIARAVSAAAECKVGAFERALLWAIWGMESRAEGDRRLCRVQSNG